MFPGWNTLCFHSPVDAVMLDCDTALFTHNLTPTPPHSHPPHLSVVASCPVRSLFCADIVRPRLHFKLTGKCVDCAGFSQSLGSAEYLVSGVIAAPSCPYENDPEYQPGCNSFAQTLIHTHSHTYTSHTPSHLILAPRSPHLQGHCV